MPDATNGVTRTKRPADLQAVVLGALVASLVGFTAILLGGGIALAVIRVREGGGVTTLAAVAAALFAALAIFAAFAAGGFVAARLSRASSLLDAVLHGLASLSLVAFAAFALVGLPALTGVGSVLTKAGVGAGAGLSTTAVLDQLAGLRIVTDLSLFKGKAVTQIVPPRSPQSESLERSIKKAGKEAKAIARDPDMGGEALDVLSDARKGASKASFTALALLCVAVLASLWGGRRGFQRARKPANPNLGSGRAA